MIIALYCRSDIDIVLAAWSERVRLLLDGPYMCI